MTTIRYSYLEIRRPYSFYKSRCQKCMSYMEVYAYQVSMTLNDLTLDNLLLP